MKNLPYMPLFVADFEADTAHLSFEEDGIYNRLLRLCWRTTGCSIPDDPVWIARRLRCGMEQYHDAVVPILKEFFSREKGRIFQKRLRLEWLRSEGISARNAEAGRLGGLQTQAIVKQRNSVKPRLST